MKRLYGNIVFCVLTGMTASAQAVDCRVNGGPLETGNPNLHVPVMVTPNADNTRIFLEGARLECRYSPGQGPAWGQDFWSTGSTAGSPWTPGPKFSGNMSGLRINGAFHNTPVPIGVRAATLPNNQVIYPINITPFILLRNDPSNPIDIRLGDTLGLLRLTATNNYDSQMANLTVTYTAANNFTISPSTCTINNNNPIEVNFGNVHQRQIGTDPLTTPIQSNRRLTYSCPNAGITTPITITYKGNATSFDNRLLMMTNPDVGTAMVRAGSAVAVNGRFVTQITNSVGGDDVTFSLVQRPGSLPAAGPVTGSGVLVMGVP
ncbi:fimbrial protein [Pseudomonas sp. DWP1b1]|uniref:fimbrial protein n=1 Tax=unclassified Pseudomonas TaxID=196821 RepID=UPI003CF4CB09